MISSLPPAAAQRSAATPARWLCERLGSTCAVCRDHASARVCRACLQRWTDVSTYRCGVCAVRLASRSAAVCGTCLAKPPGQDTAVAAVDYGYPWDGLIAGLKFRDALDLAPTLAALLAAAVRAADPPRPDWVLPVPLSRQRLAERGHNQSWELARRLARTLGFPTDPHLILRIRDTPQQLALLPEQRAANVHGAFAVEPARLADVRGRRIALVDDVMTSGATASALARALKAAGAARVQVWVVARTPPPAQR